MSPDILYNLLSLQREEIRLLRLLPSRSFDSDLECKIFTASLKAEQSPSYQALSYVWGDPDVTSDIIIDGLYSPVKVGVNLSQALRNIRNEFDEVVLWADALCINQNNLREQEHQVQMMGSIYHKAQNVIVWLGDEANDSSLAIFVLEMWALSFDDLVGRKIDRKGPPNPGFIIHTLSRTAPILFDARANLALLTLGKRPYWTRAWIFQELAFARNAYVKCGKRSIGWDIFEKAAENWRLFNVLMEVRKMRSVPPNVNVVADFWENIQLLPMFSMIRSVKKWRIPHPFHLQVLPQSMLECFNIRKAKDPRDLVFSLLGFIDPRSPHWDLIKPDYSKSIEQVYTNLAQYLIITDGTLRALNAMVIHRSIHGRTNMPSWVPDWRAQHGNTAPSYSETISPDDRVSSLVNFSFSCRVLSVKGLEIGEVTTVCQDAFQLLDNLSPKNLPEAILHDFTKHILDGAPINGETSLSTFLRIYRSLFNRNYGSSLSRMEHAETSLPLLRRLSIMMNPSESTPQLFSAIRYLVIRFLGQDAPVKEMEWLMNSIVNGHNEEFSIPVGGVHNSKYAIFRTTSGALGAGPSWTARGDKLCQLASHNQPFLLRPVRGKYRNVGQCVIWGLKLSRIEDLPTQVKVFDIE